MYVCISVDLPFTALQSSDQLCYNGRVKKDQLCYNGRIKKDQLNSKPTRWPSFLGVTAASEADSTLLTD